MSQAQLVNLSKSFGKTAVLQEIDLQIASGEFLAVLGPSGCGKTTLLRLLAGFEAPSAGQITIGDQLVAGDGVMIPPERRNLGIVFQNYALWPHLNVAENVGYALKVAKLPRALRDERVAQALKTVDLSAYADRRPADLSGGQRQRVALARCLAARSQLVLLDEPLANLDVHLRATMEEEFRRFHRESGATLIYITHDQSEAMALADRIAVMDQGRILQCASPRALYREPANAKVAAFIGNGQLLPVEHIALEAPGRARADLLGAPVTLRTRLDQRPAALGLASCHPDNLRLCAPQGGQGLSCRVISRAYRGGAFSYELGPDADQSLCLKLDLPDRGQVLPDQGEACRVDFEDLWLLPEGQIAVGSDRSIPSSPALIERQFQCV